MSSFTAEATEVVTEEESSGWQIVSLDDYMGTQGETPEPTGVRSPVKMIRNLRLLPSVLLPSV